MGFVEGALKRKRGHQASVFVAACRYCWSLPPCSAHRPKLSAHDTPAASVPASIAHDMVSGTHVKQFLAARIRKWVIPSAVCASICRSVARDPLNSSAHASKGLVLECRGDNAAAAEALQHALSLLQPLQPPSLALPALSMK